MAPINHNILSKTPEDGDQMIIDVWADNLVEEMKKIRDLVDEYPYVAMDTEFPGVVARPLGCFKTSQDFQYRTLKCNVDLLKIIQLGLCFCDEDGNVVPGVCTWQFNFKFDLGQDMYAQDSIDLLVSSGIDFKKHAARGIPVADFGELLMVSGIVLSDDVKWISFHGGYDYAYLLKVLTCQSLPAEESGFFDLFSVYFPAAYDLKCLLKNYPDMSGGLQRLSELFMVPRIGPQHQAGSDSLLTAALFFKMRDVLFQGEIDDDLYQGSLYGLGSSLSFSNEGKDPE